MRRAAVLIGAAALAAGCGGGGDAERDAVERYIEEANRTQARFTPDVRAAQSAIRSFAAGTAGAGVADRLARAAAAMRSARAALAQLEPPPEARALHRRQLELLQLQALLSEELSLAAGYLPAAVEAIEPADGAGAALARSLRKSADGASQADALEDYAAEVEWTLGRLDALGAPPVLRPWHEAQAGRLQASRNLAEGLARGIRERDRGAIDRALRAFSDESPRRKLAQRAQREAIAAFNERLEEQQDLLASIYREQAELSERFAP